MDFYQWCVLAAVSAFIVFVVFAVRAFLQITRTAEAVEYLAISTAENVDKAKNAFDLIDNVSTMLDSTFYKVMKLGMDLVKRYRGR